MSYDPQCRTKAAETCRRDLARRAARLRAPARSARRSRCITPPKAATSGCAMWSGSLPLSSAVMSGVTSPRSCAARSILSSSRSAACGWMSFSGTPKARIPKVGSAGHQTCQCKYRTLWERNRKIGYTNPTYNTSICPCWPSLMLHSTSRYLSRDLLTGASSRKNLPSRFL